LRVQSQENFGQSYGAMKHRFFYALIFCIGVFVLFIVTFVNSGSDYVLYSELVSKDLNRPIPEREVKGYECSPFGSLKKTAVNCSTYSDTKISHKKSDLEAEDNPRTPEQIYAERKQEVDDQFQKVMLGDPTAAYELLMMDMYCQARVITSKYRLFKDLCVLAANNQAFLESVFKRGAAADPNIQKLLLEYQEEFDQVSTGRRKVFAAEE
jgi:hypothetical protein